MVEKKKLNGIKIHLTSHSPCIKKIACQKSKELGCEFTWYQYLMPSLTSLQRIMTFFDTVVTRLERVNGKKVWKKRTFYYSLQSICKNLNDLKKHLFIKELMKVWVSPIILLN